MWVHIELVIQEDLLKVRVTNSKATASPAHDIDVVPKGFGLKNVKRRLILLYGDQYTLDIDNKRDFFQVEMCIPLTLVQKSNPSPHEPKLLYS